MTTRSRHALVWLVLACIEAVAGIFGLMPWTAALILAMGAIVCSTVWVASRG